METGRIGYLAKLLATLAPATVALVAAVACALPLHAFAAETPDLTISSRGDYVVFANSVQAGNAYAGKTVVLDTDLVLAQDDPSIGTISQSGNIYQPTKAFQGTFDGQGHCITLAGQPLFAMLYGAKNRAATVKNLVLAGAVESDQAYIGALAAVADGNLQFQNVGNNATVTSAYHSSESSASGTGGLVGLVPAKYNSYYHDTTDSYGSATFDGCYNKGAVKAQSDALGGFVGSFAGGGTTLTITRCYVNATIHSTQNYVGGFIGRLSEGTRSARFQGCYASGKVDTSLVVGEYGSIIVGVLMGYSYASMVSSGDIANVYYSRGLGVGKTFGDRDEQYVVDAEGNSIGVQQLALTSTSAVGTLNAGAYDESTGFTKDESVSTYPILYWESPQDIPPAPTYETVGIPRAASGLVYTGKPQSGVPPGTGYTLANESATDAGAYRATATLADGYQWSDGTHAAKAISFEIGKAPLVATYAGETVDADAAPTLAVEVSGFVNGETARTAKDYAAPTVTAPTPLEAGKTYALIPNGGKAANYSFSYRAGSLVVNAASSNPDPDPVPAAKKITAGNASITIDTRGSAIKASVSVSGTALTAGTDYEIFFQDANGTKLAATPTKAGTYTLVVTGKGAYTGSATQEFTLAHDFATASTGASSATQATQTTQSAKVGATFTVKNASGTYRYRITSVKSGGQAATLVKASVKPGKKATINTVKYQGVSYKVGAVGAKAFKGSQAKAIVLGKNVKAIGKSAFAQAKAKKITVKSAKLTKKSVKGSLKGSMVKTVKAPKSCKKKYAKFFTKANAGKKARVT